jgi:hypothetical protein
MNQDSIRIVEGDEARLAAMQFMGMTLGALKEIDNTIINRTPTLQGTNLNAESIIRNMPTQAAPPPPQLDVQIWSGSEPKPQVQIVSVPAAAPTTSPQPSLSFQVENKKDESNQIEFNFTYDIAKDIVDRLDRIEKLLNKVLKDKPNISVPLKKT